MSVEGRYSYYGTPLATGEDSLVTRSKKAAGLKDRAIDPQTGKLIRYLLHYILYSGNIYIFTNYLGFMVPSQGASLPVISIRSPLRRGGRRPSSSRLEHRDLRHSDSSQRTTWTKKTSRIRE